MTPTPLPCGWTPDPAAVALHRMDAAGRRYAAAVQAANGDPDGIAAAERDLTAALDAIEADIAAATETRTR